MVTRRAHQLEAPITRRRPRRALIAINLLLALLLAQLAIADTHFTGPLPDVDAPLADPLVKADATFSANTATSWQQDGIRLLLLEGDVVFKLGTYGFRSDRAVVRIDTQRRYQRTIRHLAVYFNEARTLHGAGRIQAEGPGLLVTASTTGRLLLDTPLLTPADAAPDAPIVDIAAERIARHRQRMAEAATGPLAPAEPLLTTEEQALRRQRRAQIAESQIAQHVARLPRRTDQRPAAEPALAEPIDQTILPTDGVVQFTADRLWADSDENAMALIGDVNVSYTDYTSDRVMTLRAGRVVIFADGDVQDALAGNRVDAARVSGVYLEDSAIITDGQYTVRAPRMYYDPQRNQAILLDAVMYAWDVRRRIPLYVRADMVRQQSRTSFEAENALLTTSEFAVPHVAIAAERVTLRQPPDGQTDAVDVAAAENMTVEVGGLPVFYWPHAAVEGRDIPLRSASFSYSQQNGPIVETTWDLFALAGARRTRGVELDLLADYQGEHGGAVGLTSDYQRPDFFGQLQSYLLPADDGDDEIADRLDVEHDADLRGFFQWQHRQQLRNDWDFSLEAAYVSDETFLEEFFPSEAHQAKTYETSAYLEKRMDDAALFSVLAKGHLSDFTEQLTTLQAPGYAVDKFPEIAYVRTGTSLFGDRATWFSDNRVSRMRINPGDDTPAERGFTPAMSMMLFDIPDTTSFHDKFDAMGVPLGWVNRFDTRQEIALPTKLGPINVTPYAVGRFTAYDDDFSAFAPAEDEQLRLWGIVGTRASVEVHSTSADAQSQVLDVHRLRHVIRPSVNVWGGGSTIDEGDLPVYDYDVEMIDAAPGLRLGLRNTLQTQRGGPGRWRSVDWIVLDTDLVLRSDDAPLSAELARYFDYRPELTTGGDHFYARLLWMVTDTFVLTGELTQNLETDDIAQWRIGATMQHTDRLSSFVDYNELPIFDSELLTYGFNYQLTTKYAVGFRQRIDLAGSSNRETDLQLERKLPRWRFLVYAAVDDIDDETVVGVVLVPEGLGGGGRNVSDLLAAGSR